MHPPKEARRRFGEGQGGTVSGVHVRTDNDMVYLTGSVPDQATRDRIDATVRNIAGHNRVPTS